MATRTQIVTVIATALASFAVFGAEKESPQAPPQATTESRIYKPWEHVWWGTRDIPDLQNAIVLGSGATLTAIAFAFDDTMVHHFAGNDRLRGAERVGNFWGTGIPGGSIAALQLGLGLVLSSKRELEAGIGHAESLIMNLGYTTALKWIIGRPRPGGGTQNSFPSGHTSTAFATATSTWEIYGPWAGVPLVGMGVFTAVSRMASNAHHLSDVVAGATLGAIVGHAYTKHHRLEWESAKEKNSSTPVAKWNWTNILPYYNSTDDFGLVATFKY